MPVLQDPSFRWVRERGPALFHVDPDRLAVIGGSAEGYLTLVSGYRVMPRPKALAANFGYGDLVGPWLSEPSPHPRHNQKKLTREEASVDFLGPAVANASERKGNSQFYAYCRQQGIWPQEISGWDPRTQLERFVPYLVEHKLITIPGGEHGFAGGDPRLISEANQAALRFIEQHVPVR